ncbi:glutathione S-transferase family protein [Roseibacterium sp. SDUM158017]|uniref:glutathione S-transferase family protein n=1 Tax=Roseicyclus salinarum TaxID=3036773 RepID=UPI002414E5FE|nr:glutathione S-transferase family protein [Roseibacterium sp. SDUM158017]MDG4647063.1 glutathione S-transferase family protein [Roseibacterium sp. SDUM158017]
MGLLVDGEWHDQWFDTKSTGGAFKRQESQFRNWVTPDGAPGPTGRGGFAAESGRYHLYVSHACPWANRTMIFRALKGLEAHIDVSVVHPDMLGEGWSFAQDFPGATGDHLFGSEHMREIYQRTDPHVTTRVTVPVLWDTKSGQIVSNESAEIIRMFNSAFDGITGNTRDFCPEGLRPRIDEVNARVYSDINNGVYKAGFATTQAAYDKAVQALFEGLDWAEGILAENRYLAGDRVTEADWRLFTTLVRFDAVYHLHFKCNRRRLIDYPNLWAYARELYQWPGVAETVHFDHIVRHYHYSHETINPHRIVPINPVIDWSEAHGRGALKAA